MPEFLKQLLALGIVGMISLSRGYDALPPSSSPTALEAVATNADQVVLLAEPIRTVANTTNPPNTHAPRTGVTIVQTDPDAPASGGPETLQVRAQRDVSAQNPAGALATPAPESTCRAIQPQIYGSLGIRGGATNYAAAQADLNLGQRAWRQVSAPLALQSIGGPTDDNAPRFSSLFAPGRVPRMSGAYQVYNWDFRSGRRTTPITSPAVTLLGFATAPGELILAPGSGYNIGDGYAALVLFAEPSRVTLKYTREDNVAVGYTLHLENICVEPHLFALYRYLNASGRRQLPALRYGQPLGTANGTQILAGIQDSGEWMDPRSRKDWWQ